ncbi:MAG TPA: DegV family protein [Clostridia bacterium]|nr:DegV family protein [Clostridia bacterium]
MDYKIIVDSCCDLTEEQRKEMGVISVPLNMVLGDEVFVDDDSLDLPDYMEKMHKYKGRIGSACPTPEMYRQAFVDAKKSFAVTLSNNLSGSYSSAVMGKRAAEDDGAETHVFDSKSASAGEVLIVFKIRKLLAEGMARLKIIQTVENFIREMKTYFVLDNIDNLLKNGRLNRIKGSIIQVLNIKPIMGSDGDGNIALYSKARGQNQIIETMADTIKKSGRETKGQDMVIAHCNNQSLAEKLSNVIKSRYNFANILIVRTRGISSMYANIGGVIMAF